MFEDRDGEKEILLGNKQLLGIFFVLAILFGVFFTAGYMVGRAKGSGDKQSAQAASAVEAKSTSVESPAANGGETHAVSPDGSGGASEQASTQESPRTEDSARAITSREPLGSRSALRKPKPEKTALTRSEEEQEPAAALNLPSGHNTYLQVAALGRTEAEAVARVLNKKGFSTHIAPKPGSAYYRVLVGPVRDAGDLNSTRDALKNKGFREVFVQHL
jgi:cell division protein FtsN